MTDSLITDPNLHHFRYPMPFMGRGESSCCCSDTRENGMYVSDGEFGIKFLSHGAMAILYIPKGSLVHIDGYGPTKCRRDVDKFQANAKCRTELALCVEIGKFVLGDDIKEKIDEKGNLSFSANLEIIRRPIGESLYGRKSLSWRTLEEDNTHVRYQEMRLVYPFEPFDMDDEVCAPGIHYYHHIINFDQIFRADSYMDMGSILNAWMDHVASSRTIKEFEEIVAEERTKLTISNRNLLGYANGTMFMEEVEQK